MFKSEKPCEVCGCEYFYAKGSSFGIYYQCHDCEGRALFARYSPPQTYTPIAERFAARGLTPLSPIEPK
jgi:hypothetical protein